MLRILTHIGIYGTKASVERFASVAAIPSGSFKQCGLKRKVPDVDSWNYSSPYFQFRFDTLDDEIRDFLVAHAQVGKAVAIPDEGITWTLFTVTPVSQSFEDEFSCLLSTETLQALSATGLALEINPEAIMPDAPFWTSET